MNVKLRQKMTAAEWDGIDICPVARIVKNFTSYSRSEVGALSITTADRTLIIPKGHFLLHMEGEKSIVVSKEEFEKAYEVI